MEIFNKHYGGESLYDIDRDVSEALDEEYNSALASIPKDESGFQTGTFRVSIVWVDQHSE